VVTAVLATLIVAREPATDPAGPLTAVFFGDSWTEGTGADSPDRGWAPQVAQAEGWSIINTGQGGTGYVTDGPPESPERAPLPDRVADVVARDPEIVLVAAGINDAGRGYSNQQVTDAVEATLRPLTEQLPDARVLVIGPWWNNGEPTKSASTVNEIVQQVAADLGLPFVSPMAEKWITGSNDGTVLGNRVQYIGPDNAHPSQAGHDYLAGKVEAWLDTVPDLPTRQ
jgi:lysophospholipase L1-like esterase